MVTVDSPIAKNDSLLIESNDTFEITYNFFEKDGLVAFVIYNKSSVPLYVDWKRSAFIVGTNKTDYWTDATHFVSVTQGYNIQWLRDFSTSRNKTAGVIIKPEQITFIPPKTAISMARFKISNSIWNSGLKEQEVPKNYKKGKTKIKTANYTDSTSPYKFRNFLTLSLKHDFSSEFYIDHAFWIKNIAQMIDTQFYGPYRPTQSENGYIAQEPTYPLHKPNRYYNIIIEEDNY